LTTNDKKKTVHDKFFHKNKKIGVASITTKS
jgi:hypothetical protein